MKHCCLRPPIVMESQNFYQDRELQFQCNVLRNRTRESSVCGLARRSVEAGLEPVIAHQSSRVQRRTLDRRLAASTASQRPGEHYQRIAVGMDFMAPSARREGPSLLEHERDSAQAPVGLPRVHHGEGAERQSGGVRFGLFRCRFGRRTARSSMLCP